MKTPKEVYHQRIANEKPFITFEMLADIHQISCFKDKTLRRAFDDIKQRDIHYLFCLGDLTNNACFFQFRAFFSLLNPYGFHHLIALGNHDLYHAHHDESMRIDPTCKRYVYRHEVYYKEELKGCSFYVLNTQKPQKDNMYFEKDQLEWLQDDLNQDKNNWKFVLCHHPLANTHPGSERRDMHIGYQNAQLEKILLHHHVIYISAHLHNSYSLPALYLNKDILCVNVPAFHQVEHGIKKDQVGMQIQVFTDFLYIRFYDHQEHRFLDSVTYIYDHKHRIIHII